MRQCVELLASISAAVDRNTKIMDLVANHIMHGRPGATGEIKTSSSAVQESEDESDENLSKVKTRRFRAHAKHPKHKDANELRLQVSGISTNRLIDLVVSTSPQASAKINISYSILFNLTTSYSSYSEGKKGISRNKTSFFLLMG